MRPWYERHLERLAEERQALGAAVEDLPEATARTYEVRSEELEPALRRR